MEALHHIGSVVKPAASGVSSSFDGRLSAAGATTVSLLVLRVSH